MRTLGLVDVNGVPAAESIRCRVAFCGLLPQIVHGALKVTKRHTLGGGQCNDSVSLRALTCREIFKLAHQRFTLRHARTLSGETA